MSRHAAPRRRKNTPFDTRMFTSLRSARVRAVLSLGIVLGFGAVSTMAYWTDSATVTGGTFTAGTLDLKLSTNGTSFVDGPVTWSDFTLQNMVPGSTKTGVLSVKNTGTVDFNYAVTASTSASLNYQPYLLFWAKVLPTGGTCPAPGPFAAYSNVGNMPTTVVSAQPLNSNANGGVVQKFCVAAKLADNAPGDPAVPSTDVQGESATVTYKFNAVQVGP